LPENGNPTVQDLLRFPWWTHTPKLQLLHTPPHTQPASKNKSWSLLTPREGSAQVPNITHPFWICEAVISKDEAPKQELSWHQDQGLKLITQHD